MTDLRISSKEVTPLRPSRAMVLLTAGLVTLIGMQAATAAELPTDLYVDDNPACTDSGSGTQASPFCTLAPAVKAAKPGQTVHVETLNLRQRALTIDRSGAPGKPVTYTFTPENPNWGSAVHKLAISGASHVVVQGLTVSEGVSIGDSHDVVLEGIVENPVWGGSSLTIGGASTDVRVSRSTFHRAAIGGGAQRTVLSRNVLRGTGPLSVVDAPGTVITNNHVDNFTDENEGVGSCDETVVIRGASTGSSVFNNVLMASGNTTCTTPQLSVAQSATSGTRAGYNLIAGAEGYATVAYQWAGTTYPTAAAFLAASGQGTRDILIPTAAPLSGADSPAIDSADATAPGVLPVDRNGIPTTDDPRVANTGKDGGYLDRGASETHDGLNSAWMGVDNPWAPTGTRVTLKGGSDSKWPTTMTYTADFGDGTAPAVVRPGDTADITAAHSYDKPGSYTVKLTATNGGGKKVTKEQTIRVTSHDDLATAFTAVPLLPAPNEPNRVVRPLTLRVDTTSTVAPWGIGWVKVDFGDGTVLDRPGLQTATHSYKQPGTYEVKVLVHDVKGTESTATRTVQVGYAPSGYVSTTPFRLLDTRTTGPSIKAGSPRSVPVLKGANLPGQFNAGGMASAVLNVTVTGATQDTHLSVWSSGQARPDTSNVNVRAGGTSSNTVTVPIGADGTIQAQLNSGEASLIVDFVGYYQPGAGQRFSPLAPTRVLDTRKTGGALGGGKRRTVKVAGVNGIPADAKAVALNLTGTGATQEAFVSVFQNPARRPHTSNLNVEPGKDKSNQAIVPIGPDGTVTLFTNSGSTHLVLDAVGYYGQDGKTLFTPVVPKRLADTRTTGKVAPGATATVSGLPANATGAVLNVTATDTTGSGFLTAYAFGGTLPGASSLNTLPGITVPNHVTTPVGPGGKVSIFNSYGGPNHVITDLLGYFTTG
ncbi:PKD domain-containing protein [Streptomyces sp. NPDC058401]|uniref:PKD domain-containing protein n=1 Tax=Streptomyces sp. NPDC058401 TaxID=3346480 RepID=UPI003651AE03